MGLVVQMQGAGLGTVRLDGSGSDAMVYSPELDQPLKDYLVLIGF